MGGPSSSTMPTVAVPDNPDHLILTVSSTLSDRTDWSADKSIATNYDYTQYVPPTCSEFYGSLAVDSESIMPQLASDGAATNNWHERNINCQTMYSTVTDQPHSIKGISKLPDFAVDETSIAGETFEAGPRLELEESTANTYYVVTDDVEQCYDKKKGKKSIFQMARLPMPFGRKKTSSEGFLPSEINIGQKSKKSGYFGRFKSNKKYSNDNTTPSTPKPADYVPSMLTPTSSPCTDNVTPSGLNAFHHDMKSSTAMEPPKMPSRTNSLSSMSIFAKQDNASLTDVTHSGSDDSPENSPALNRELIPMIVCNVVDNESLSRVDEASDEVEPVEEDGNTDSNSVASTKCDDKGNVLETTDVTDNGAVDGATFSEEVDAVEPAELTDISFSGETFFNPLVLENDTEIEMEYLGPLVSESASETKIVSSERAVAAPVKKKRPTPKPTTEPVFLKVNSAESDSTSIVITEYDETAIKNTASRDTTEKQIPKEAREKQTIVKRGLAFLSKRNNIEAQSSSTPRENESPTNTGVVISEEEIATIQDYEKLSPEYVVESQPERNVKVYNRGLSIRTKSVVAEAQMRAKMPDIQNDMSPTHNSGQPVGLSKFMSMKTNQGAKNVTSFDDTIFNGVSLASDSACDEDGTVQEPSIMDYDDGRSESSLTFRSNDSTYLSDASDAGCNIQRVLFDDLNDAVEDVREGVLDMVAAVRSTPVRRQRVKML